MAQAEISVAERAWWDALARVDQRRAAEAATLKLSLTRNEFGQQVVGDRTECAPGVWLAPGESTPWRQIPGSGAWLREVGQGAPPTDPPGFKKYERPAKARE